MQIYYPPGSGEGSDIPTPGTNGTVLVADDTADSGMKWDSVSGTGDVTAAAAFANDNRALRSDGTGKGSQASLVTINDAGAISSPSSISAATALFAGGNLNDGVFQVVNGADKTGSISSSTLTDDRGFELPDRSGTLMVGEGNGAEFADKAATLATLGGGALAGNNTWSGSNIFNLAPRVPTTDLASGTALTIGTYYYKSISADLGPLTFSGTPAEGSTVLLHLTVSGTRTVTFPSCYRNGEASSTITSLLFPPGEYVLLWQYRNSKWILSDPLGALHNSTTSDPTANDDAADGYVAGKSIWINTSTGRIFILRDSTATAAVWECINREKVAIGIACSDETTAITTGTAKATFRMPFAMTVTDVRANVNTAPTGSTILIDINEGGTTILSTKLMIDASEKTSTTAATPAVISDTALADDSEITVDFDQVGSSVAGAGVKVWLIGYRSAA